MRINQPVSQRNIPVAEDANILSTTNPKGQITHINDEFVEISGFSREELISQPHNIIRHPDMPRAAYEEMWRRLKAGQSWIGAVKNRCKNGDHYWVQAYAIPVTGKNGELVELQSIRSRLSEERIKRAEALYARVKQSEPAKGPLPAVSLKRSPALASQLALAAVILLSLQAAGLFLFESPAAMALTWLSSVFLGLGVIAWLTSPLKQLVRRARNIIDDPVAEQIFSGRLDDIGSIELAITQKTAELDAVVKRLDDVIGQLDQGSENTIRLSENAHGAVREQASKTGHIATAADQMSAMSQNVADSAARMKEQVKKANERVAQGQSLTKTTRDSMDSLSRELREASDAVSQLAENSRGVTDALRVIAEITEQTNLLALNASIEAARAGEAGRGFAVVADEVRGLASRTRQSTEQIEETLGEFQNTVTQATQSMHQCARYAQTTVENAVGSETTLTELVNYIEQIAADCDATSSAAEQQHDSATEISTKIESINDLGDEARNLVQEAQTSTKTLKDQIVQVSGLIQRLRSRSLS
ncbi:methyl-accepting chemotaxis sensory transducer with Pas/Pac sensor [Marinobacter daqiaonensis]|uniref:Methyl-accepting chemotaxis sensory transducer with Pas/Pac sensor n=1 Tax=Marinobacter daqiaonensis TaxID=650891 RepID=A0A1I6GYJ6_9GAMM|nr:PAS domain-containing methyl-accepting chemotaxis protein [Marinobacter daqiaonensis]SFR47111.1 methyl-accepting chemotaxis sensory transducer with Pas/Pac sensor [Marinobacter daqiaonensis]